MTPWELLGWILVWVGVVLLGGFALLFLVAVAIAIIKAIRNNLKR